METIKFLDIIWGKNDCWVDVPSKAGSRWVPWYTEWPANRPLVRDRIREATNDGEDVYFSAARFRSRGRSIKHVLPTRWLWADLDRVDPVFLDEDNCLPTLAWESSPGRYQCMWRLSQSLPPQKQTDLNRRLTQALGADAGGYDLTQVLRPIGTKNFKYDPVADVEYLWYDRTLVYKPTQILQAIRAMKAEEEGVPIRDPRIPRSAWHLLNTKPEMVREGERSDQLWKISRILSKANFDEDDQFSLIWPCAWNIKHREERDGERRLRATIKKAIASIAKPKKPKPKVQEPKFKSRHIEYARMISAHIPTPRWLIENVWAGNSHGIIGGEAKTAKSTTAMAMALSVASGKPFLADSRFKVRTQGPVLFIQEENSEWWVQDRLRKLAHKYGLLGGSVKRVRAPKGQIVRDTYAIEMPPLVPLNIINRDGMDFLNNEEDKEYLEWELREFDYKMVVIDPLYYVIPALNLSASHEITPVLKWLQQLGDKYDCAMVLVHHTAKWTENATQRRAGQRLLGSAMFHGWIDSALYTQKLNGEELQIRLGREFRNAPPQPDLDVSWDFGEPGEAEGLEIKISDFSQHARVRDLVDEGRAAGDPRGYNVKNLIQPLDLGGNTPESRMTAAELVRDAGYTVWKVPYANGYGFVVYPDDIPGGKFAKKAVIWNGH